MVVWMVENLELWNLSSEGYKLSLIDLSFLVDFSPPPKTPSVNQDLDRVLSATTA